MLILPLHTLSSWYGTTEKGMGLVIGSLSLDETLGPNRWKGCAEPCRKTPNSVNVGF